jgi:hypothetical protein
VHTARHAVAFIGGDGLRVFPDGHREVRTHDELSLDPHDALLQPLPFAEHHPPGARSEGVEQLGLLPLARCCVASTRRPRSASTRLSREEDERECDSGSCTEVARGANPHDL